MSYTANQSNKQCISCIYWSGKREIKHLIKRIEFDGGSLSGTCIKRESPKFNTNQNWGATCMHHSSILR